MNARIERVGKGIRKVKEKANEFQAKLRELEKQKTEFGNLEIVDTVHGMGISLTDLADLLKTVEAGGVISGQLGLKSTVHDESKEEEIEGRENLA